MYVHGSNTTLTNSILWGNNASEGAEIVLRSGTFGPASLIVSYSNVQGGWSGIGNINADP